MGKHLPNLVAVCAAAGGPDDAADAVGELLGVSSEEASAHLADFSLLDLTRSMRTELAAELAELRRE